MPTRTFTREQLEEMGVPYEWDAEPGKEAEILHTEQVDSRRWVSIHEVVFRAPDDGRVWSVGYQEGLTESQDGTDLWFDDDTVTAVEMDLVEVTVQEWRKVAD
ncbi:hypothetical protein [Streptomyces sp. NPDC058272]|uniref:hypothetical protein n=1 Tax=Streptomyces sp. NPDC058272 TaxID=3346415 RepID=UPI0036F1436A